MLKKLATAATLAATLAACDDSTGPGEEPLTLKFTTSQTALADGASAQLTGQGQLVVPGANGTLVIDELLLVVAEFELERSGQACVMEGDDDRECDSFEALPSLLDLPLGGTAVPVATDAVPAGRYTALEFEVEDLDLDDLEDEDEPEDAAKVAAIREIATELEARFGAGVFPDEASMVVVGSFTPTGGTARPFVVFVDAEFEVEKELTPPIDIPGTSALVVNIDPAQWFVESGNVVDLSLFNRQLVEFDEDRFELGFGEIEEEDD